MRLSFILSFCACFALSGCGTSHHWFEEKSWFEEKGVEEFAPNYIPLAAVPERKKIKKLK